MKKLLRILLCISVVFVSFSSIFAQEDSIFDCPEGEADLVFATGAVGRELELTVEIFERFMELCPNINVSALETPDLATDRLSLYIQFMGARSSAVDVYQIDIPWIGIFAQHMIDLYDYAPPDSETIQQHFPATIENNTQNGKLVGMPWFTDAGLLYYRTDLLEKYDLDVPTTWDELEQAALTIQEGEREEGNADFWGYVWQGNNGEPTTINALEWQASNGGGVIISPQGEIQVNNPEAIDAIEQGASWIGEISPPTVIGHTPEASRTIWQAGDAAFMRNWPYAYNLGNAEDSPIQGLFDITTLPAGDAGIRTGVLGGWQLSVSSFSEHPDAAAALVLYMTSPEVQKLRAIELGNAPTIQALYDDEEILEAAPFLTDLREALLNATPRPSNVSGERYSDVSRMYSDAVHSVLRGEEDARTAMEDLEFDLEDLMAQIDIPTEVPSESAEATEEAVEIEETEEAVVEEPTEAEETVTEEVPAATEVEASPTEQPTTTESTADDSQSDNSTTIIIIAIVAVVVLAGGAYFFLGRNKTTG